MTTTKFKPSNHPMRDMLAPAGFNSFIDNLFRENELERKSTSFFRPSVDVVENPGNYQIQINLPGVKKEEITIDIEGNELTISGERKQVSEEKDSKFHLGEIQYGKFSRTFYLPELVDQDKIEARYADGVLSVSIPKTEKAKPKTVSIR